MPERYSKLNGRPKKVLAQNIADALRDRRKKEGKDFIGLVATTFSCDYVEGALDFLEEDLRRELLNRHGLIGYVENHFKPLRFPKWTLEQYRRHIGTYQNNIFLMFDPYRYLELSEDNVGITNLESYFRKD